MEISSGTLRMFVVWGSQDKDPGALSFFKGGSRAGMEVGVGESWCFGGWVGECGRRLVLASISGGVSIVGSCRGRIAVADAGLGLI